MKVQSIIKIADILKKNKQEEDDAYKDIRSHLDEKYGVGWANNQLTEEEFEALRQQREICVEATEVYEEFRKYDL